MRLGYTTNMKKTLNHKSKMAICEIREQIQTNLRMHAFQTITTEACNVGGRE